MDQRIETILHLADHAHEMGDRRKATIKLKVARILAARTPSLSDDLHAKYQAIHTKVYGTPIKIGE